MDNKTELKKKAIIYARVSSTGDRQSTERQVVDLTSYAQYANLQVEKVFEEKVSGAKKNCERPILMEALEYARKNKIDEILVSELSRIGRNSFEVLSTVKQMIDAGINIYFQKEQFRLLEHNKKLSLFTPILIATLSTCAQLERDNISYRLNSGRKLYIEKGGKLGRPKGTGKTEDRLSEEYKKVIKELRNGTSVRRTALLCQVSNSTVQRVKKAFNL